MTLEMDRSFAETTDHVFEAVCGESIRDAL
jgi:hypothetical protein